MTTLGASGASIDKKGYRCDIMSTLQMSPDFVNDITMNVSVTGSLKESAYDLLSFHIVINVLYLLKWNDDGMLKNLILQFSDGGNNVNDEVRSGCLQLAMMKFHGGLHLENNDLKAGDAPNLTSLAEEFEISKSFVTRAWKVFQAVGTALRKVDGGIPRKATAVDDRYIFLQVKRVLY
ncbi:hypothetical protein TNCV_627121 [Trichonephila clavipes]|nr:hypothetical protein TNCV_627121 [Trichonephila clavipes]